MIFEADNIELYFDSKRILYGVYLKVETGKITGILGRNGCGKSCLLRIIFGNLIPKHKNLRKDGVYQKKKLFRTDTIAYLPQHGFLPKSIKLGNVFNMFNIGWSDFIKVFDSFEIYENTKTGQLSSGELRIVETYLILFSKKEIILLDEPFSFIAPIYVEKIKALIQEKKKDSAIIVTDHYYSDILDVSDTIYFLKNGSSKLIRTRQDLEDEGYLKIY